MATIKLQKFIDEHNGKFIITTPKLGPQCVALMRTYCRDVLGLGLFTIPPATYAYQMYERFPDVGDSNFLKIKNEPNNWPLPGDIVFIKKTCMGVVTVQHVSVATGGNKKSFISFDQNWPKHEPCKYINHSYQGVLGWLRPIKRDSI